MRPVHKVFVYGTTTSARDDDDGFAAVEPPAPSKYMNGPDGTLAFLDCIKPASTFGPCDMTTALHLGAASASSC